MGSSSPRTSGHAEAPHAEDYSVRDHGLASEVVPRKRPKVAMRPRLTEPTKEFFHGRAVYI
ncbi:hypothetical protein [Arcanobacterium pinnipediorum]|uniref:Uncharacterized protein n=1 Tax=Arcanobacterium pinnipediorum TaxID=1503041 RepID=A0ABY5AJ82_9ACTO|nr:hypothetical protein [Arcanobacterium pinnipediorum]USR79917.1 hypothetical protein NG665_02750 [Arcanobacterium pinnipediorum]